MQPGMGEMENIGNIEIKKYHIGFRNCEINIDKYCIENISLILNQPVQKPKIWKNHDSIFCNTKIQPVSF